MALRTDRLHGDSGKFDVRLPYQRDCDRIIYTSAFQRLAEVTQVVSPDEGHVFHNRLTHSLKVAQVARRLAEKLLQEQPEDVAAIGGLDADVATAAALAHDLGHPPFGHLAEEELDMAVRRAGLADGYEGNAQSFRIVTKLALKGGEYRGLNLTRATLDAILKYPWQRSTGGKESKKWGAYYTEKTEFEWVREIHPPKDKTKSIEAEIMDWADDITYAIHDAADFYAAGRIPLDRLGSAHDNVERKHFFDEVFNREGPQIDGFPRAELETEFEKLIPLWGFGRYQGTTPQRAALRAACSGLIGRYIGALTIRRPGPTGDQRLISITADSRKQVAMLKQLTWHYVIVNERLKTQQHGQRKLIRELFEVHRRAAKKKEYGLFPSPYRERLEPTAGAELDDPSRVVADYIASMTEKQALHLSLRLRGISPGSALH